MDSGWYLGEGEPVLFKHVAFSRVNIPSSVFPHSKAYGIQINTKGTFVKLKKMEKGTKSERWECESWHEGVTQFTVCVLPNHETLGLIPNTSKGNHRPYIPPVAATETTSATRTRAHAYTNRHTQLTCMHRKAF